MTEFTDGRLCDLAQQGDKTARAELVRRYVSLVNLRAKVYIDKTNGFEQEDLGQEGFIGLLSAINDYREEVGAGFKTFALLCIDRKITDAVKRALRKKQVPKNVITSLDNAVNIGSPSAEREVIAKDECSRFFQQLENNASSYEKQVFLLYLGGYTYRQIADRLSSTPKSVENALSRVRKKVAE